LAALPLTLIFWQLHTTEIGCPDSKPDSDAAVGNQHFQIWRAVPAYRAGTHSSLTGIANQFGNIEGFVSNVRFGVLPTGTGAKNNGRAPEEYGCTQLHTDRSIHMF
jgi:hypothetical protein